MIPLLWLLVFCTIVLAIVTLAVVGIQRGLRSQLIVFASWWDFSLTCVVVLLPIFSGPWLLKNPESLLGICCLNCLVAVWWTVATVRSTRQYPELWFSVPAKLGLVALTVLGTLIALSCVGNALKEKASPRERALNGAIALGAGYSVAKAFSLSKQLIQQAALVPRAPRNLRRKHHRVSQDSCA